MNIGVLTDSISDKSTGIGNYTMNFVSLILKRDLVNEPILIDYQHKRIFNVKTKIIHNPFKILRTYLWHNYLPLRLNNTQFNYIINLTSVPHFFQYKPKEIFFVYDISWYLFPEHHKSARVLYYRLLFKKTLKNSYKIVVDSQHTKNDLMKHFSVSEEKIHVIYPTVQDILGDERRPKIIHEGIKFILYVGTLEPRKNVESIVRAFFEVKKRIKNPYKLVICGKKGWKYDEIFSLVKNLELENDVIFTGYVSDEEKKYLYNHSEFLVYPSFYEGFGIPVIEAMASKLPVITSNVSSLPEVAGDAALLVDPSSIDQIRDAMIKLLTDKKVGDDLRLKGLRNLKRIDNTKQIQSLISELT